MAKKYGTCSKTGKRRYRDEIAAKLAIASTGKAGRDEKRAYRCGFCRGWHLTSMPLEDRKTPKALTTSDRVA